MTVSVPKGDTSAKLARAAGSSQAIGRKPQQEDALAIEWLPRAKGGAACLLVVADGVGGSPAGEEASQLAVDEIARRLADGRDLTGLALRDAVEQAGRAIVERAASRSEWHGMSTTCTAVLVQDGHLNLAHVGDSRAYYCDRHGTLTQLTQDHTWRAEAVAAGRSVDELRNHPNANMVTRFLGGEVSMRADTNAASPEGEGRVDTAVTPLAVAGGQILLCTDGVSGALADEQIAATLCRYPAQRAAQRLVELAERAGAGDNLTAVVLDLDQRRIRAWPVWAYVAVPLAALLLIALALRGFSASEKAYPQAGGAPRAGLVLGQSSATATSSVETMATLVSADRPQPTSTLVALPTSPRMVAVADAYPCLPIGAEDVTASSTLTAATGSIALVSPGPDAAVAPTSLKLDWEGPSLAENEAFWVTLYREGYEDSPITRQTRDTFVVIDLSGFAQAKYFWQVTLQARDLNGAWQPVALGERWYFWVASASGSGKSSATATATQVRAEETEEPTDAPGSDPTAEATEPAATEPPAATEAPAATQVPEPTRWQAPVIGPGWPPSVRKTPRNPKW